MEFALPWRATGQIANSLLPLSTRKMALASGDDTNRAVASSFFYPCEIRGKLDAAAVCIRSLVENRE